MKDCTLSKGRSRCICELGLGLAAEDVPMLHYPNRRRLDIEPININRGV